MGSTKQWVIGVAITVVLGVPGIYFTYKAYIDNRNHCVAAGTLYDNALRSPVAEAQVGYRSSRSGSFQRLGTTGSKGEFEVDCSGLQDSDVPFDLVFFRPASSPLVGLPTIVRCYVTSDQPPITRGEHRNLNVYVPGCPRA